MQKLPATAKASPDGKQVQNDSSAQGKLVKKAFLFFALNLVFVFSFSQAQKADSLNKILAGKILDTVRVQTLIALAGEHYLSSPAVAIKDCEEARTISEKINYPNGISSSYGWLAFLYEQQGNISKS